MGDSPKSTTSRATLPKRAAASASLRTGLGPAGYTLASKFMPNEEDPGRGKAEVDHPVDNEAWLSGRRRALTARHQEGPASGQAGSGQWDSATREKGEANAVPSAQTGQDYRHEQAGH